MGDTTPVIYAIFVVMLVFFVVYIIMVSPSERARIFETEEASGNLVVYIRGGNFAPHEITISMGQTIKWINQDSISHRIVGAEFESQTLEKGDSFSHKFEKEGIFIYTSETKTSAIGRVIVKN